MLVNIYYTNNSKNISANGYYDGKSVTILAGSKISEDTTTSARGSAIKQYREDSMFVSEDCVVIKNCIFTSPSAAARFVTGRSVNRYDIWKVNENETLSYYLQRTGKRVPIKRNHANSKKG